MNLFQQAAALQEQNRTFAWVTILESKGSTPRHQARMIVTEDGQNLGTIGGGPAEYAIIADAVKAMKEGRSQEISYTLNKETIGGLNMQCGGQMRIYVDVIPAKRRMYLIGGGHVNLEVAWMASRMGYAIAIVDDRPAYATEDRFPMAAEIYVEQTMKEALERIEIARGDVVIVATKDDDYTPLVHILQRAEPAYLGMIGSARKVHKVFEQARKAGVDRAKLRAVHAPIGLDIGSETPTEIALSILSEVTAVLNGGSGKPLREFQDEG